MKRRIYWGLGVLIIILIGVSAFILLQNTDTEPDIIVNHVEPSKDNPPDDEPGFVWEWHFNHWHKVPLSEANSDITEENSDTTEVDSGYRPQDPRLDERGFLHTAKDKLNSRPLPGPRTDLKPQSYFGPLTYHEELLEKHPVKALILQSEERGHWSADWILPLPPEDEEAQAFAKVTYLIIYYQSIKDTDNPIFEKALKDSAAMRRVWRTYPYGGRVMDLMRLTWPSLRDGTMYAVKSWPSEYLGIPKHTKD